MSTTIKNHKSAPMAGEYYDKIRRFLFKQDSCNKTKSLTDNGIKLP